MRTLILASGGLDSSVVAGIYAGRSVHLWIDYGQRNLVQERQAARRIAQHFAAPLIYGAVNFDALSRSSVTKEGYGKLSGPTTVVPNRNAILLSLGVAAALEHACERVAIGCNRADHDVYADCRPEFIHAYNEVAMRATGGQVCVEAPLMLSSKRGIGQWASEMGLPIDETWSCYAPVDRGIVFGPCGECNACIGREEALGVSHR